MLEKHASREVSVFYKHFILKGKSGATKIECSAENATSMVYEIYILELFLILFILVLAF